jgi:hypothetical protein
VGRKWQLTAGAAWARRSVVSRNGAQSALQTSRTSRWGNHADGVTAVMRAFEMDWAIVIGWAHRLRFVGPVVSRLGDGLPASREVIFISRFNGAPLGGAAHIW